jgi:hypothetical protein
VVGKDGLANPCRLANLFNTYERLFASQMTRIADASGFIKIIPAIVKQSALHDVVHFCGVSMAEHAMVFVTLERRASELLSGQ